MRWSGKMAKVKTGLDILIDSPPAHLRKANLGLLANQGSVGSDYEHASTLIDHALPGRLKVLLGPQHGFTGEKQDNMVESPHGIEKGSGRPIYSLYGESRYPTREMLDGLDVLLIDLLDVGTRVYTFAQTMAYCLEVAAQTRVKVVILDRPNPIGGLEVEGNILRPACASFVGLYPLPMRHGLTMGELAGFVAEHLDHKPEIEVIKVQGWQRSMYFNETGLPWVMPSPNMPTPETAWVYPGQVIWEGTNVSEGRGTTRPFQLWGAPFIDAELVKEEALKRGIEGAFLRVADFEPTFHKFQGRLCHGLEIHPLEPRVFKPYRTSLTLLEIVLKLYPQQFVWKQPPYEYEYERLPIDLILGDKAIREGLEKGLTADELLEAGANDLAEFQTRRTELLLY